MNDQEAKHAAVTAEDGVRERMRTLEAELRRHTRLYYEAAAPEISDQAFDAMLRELRDLEAAHPEWASPDSPTRRVGGMAISQFEKVTHPVPLESLQDVFSLDELWDFDARVRETIPAAWEERPARDSPTWRTRCR